MGNSQWTKSASSTAVPQLSYMYGNVIFFPKFWSILTIIFIFGQQRWGFAHPLTHLGNAGACCKQYSLIGVWNWIPRKMASDIFRYLADFFTLCCYELERDVLSKENVYFAKENKWWIVCCERISLAFSTSLAHRNFLFVSTIIGRQDCFAYCCWSTREWALLWACRSWCFSRPS